MTRSWIVPGVEPDLYLADKSALVRAASSTVGRRLRQLASAGLLATCAIVELEVLYSARSRRDYDNIADELAGFEHLPIDEAVMDRAKQTQRALAAVGMHRLPIPDLVIAAVAEEAGATVLHYDRDFERIAAVTGHAHEWIVEPGSID